MSIRMRYAASAATLSLVLVTGARAQTVNPKEAANPTKAAPLSEAYPVEGVGDGVTAGGYNQSRWVEDWTKYKNPAKRDDPLDRLKFIPITSDGDVYLTLSGELRLRVNETTNPNLRESEAQRQDIVRLVGGGDLHIGKHIRLYGELAHGSLEGQNLGTVLGTLRNRLVVQQSFADLTGEIGGADVGVRYGRQTFADGPNLMVVPRDNNTIFLVYNGTRAWARGKTLRADVFDFRLTQLGVNGTGDDISDRTRRFSGLSAGVVLPKGLLGGSKLFLDPFVWRLRNTKALWGTTTTLETRTFYGLHLWGDAGRTNLDWTLNYQGGTFDNRPIAAWLFLAAQTYRIGKDKNAPRVGFHVDYASGGGAYGKGTLRTALAPFGNNIYYSYQLFATPTNLVALAPMVSVSPLRNLRVAAEYQLSWRDSLTDAVYRANGAAFAGTQTLRARKIADTIRMQAVYTVSPRVSLTGRYEHLIAGPALTGAGYRNSAFLAGWISFRF
ncbi:MULTISPECIES: alginate export family protein [unclassified Sphingomonas]|jgi:Alginate export|uniref:alginate export family protein n=3 Tax=Bacteria TaxID=2 RepID=UPI00286EF6F4|nr:alginate export family protein [Sphingomonas sp.]